jgi:hypothetical protein
MKWLTKGWFLKEQQLGPYFDYYCLQRLSPTLDYSQLIEYKEKPLEPSLGFCSLIRLLVALALQ